MNLQLSIRRYLHYLIAAVLLQCLAACGGNSAGKSPSPPLTVTSDGLATVTAPAIATLSRVPTATPEPYGYPPPSATPAPYIYPAASATTGAASPAATSQATEDTSYLPFSTGGSASGAETMTPEITVAPASPTAAPIVSSPTPEPFATLDVAARMLALQGTDRQLAFSKIGFHVTFLEEKDHLDQWMQELDAAGIPFFLKTVDNAEPLYEAQLLMQESGVQHTLVFRATGGVPDYSLPPAVAARAHWEFHREKFPPELDPELVWVETINEVDKNRSVWLAQFALETARLMMADGFRWAAFSWAPGEPEPRHWQSPEMLEFLRLAGENPDRLAIALHEGSLSADDIRELYPFRVGRFLSLFEICDEHSIPRPTVLITEWGWAYDNIPAVDRAMADIAWASHLYAHFPEVKGAATWNLGSGCCFGDVSQQVRGLIDPLRRFNLTTSYEAPRVPLQASTDPDRYR